jgi:hypothetical protein
VLRRVVRGVGVAIGIVLIAVGSHTRALGVVVLVANVVAVVGFSRARSRGSVAPHELVRSFDVGPDETFGALRAAVEQLGYRMRSLDAEKRTIIFSTGMSLKTWAGQNFSAVVRDSVDGASEVCLVGETSQSGLGALQSVSWGETEQLANRVLDLTARSLEREIA